MFTIASFYKSVLGDLLLKPRFGRRLEHLPVELYVAVPHGAAYGPPYAGALASIGVSLGCTYFFHRNWGINGELGWTLRMPFQGANNLHQLSLLRINMLWAS